MTGVNTTLAFSTLLFVTLVNGITSREIDVKALQDQYDVVLGEVHKLKSLVEGQQEHIDRNQEIVERLRELCLSFDFLNGTGEGTSESPNREKANEKENEKVWTVNNMKMKVLTLEREDLPDGEIEFTLKFEYRDARPLVNWNAVGDCHITAVRTDFDDEVGIGFSTASILPKQDKLTSGNTTMAEWSSVYGDIYSDGAVVSISIDVTKGEQHVTKAVPLPFMTIEPGGDFVYDVGTTFQFTVVNYNSSEGDYIEDDMKGMVFGTVILNHEEEPETLHVFSSGANLEGFQVEGEEFSDKTEATFTLPTSNYTVNGLLRIGSHSLTSVSDLFFTVRVLKTVQVYSSDESGPFAPDFLHIQDTGEFRCQMHLPCRVGCFAVGSDIRSIVIKEERRDGTYMELPTSSAVDNFDAYALLYYEPENKDALEATLSCTVKNDRKERTEEITVIFTIPPKVLRESSFVERFSDETIRVTCVARGNPSPELSFHYMSEYHMPLSFDPEYMITTQNVTEGSIAILEGPVPKSDQYNYGVTSTEEGNSGSVFCVASSDGKTDSLELNIPN